MKKIPKSITRIVRLREGGVQAGRRRLSYLDYTFKEEENSLLVYRVTYSLFPKGEYKVKGAWSRSLHGWNVTFISKQGFSMPVCWLPKSWIGLKISRTVTPIRRTR